VQLLDRAEKPVWVHGGGEGRVSHQGEARYEAPGFGVWGLGFGVMVLAEGREAHGLWCAGESRLYCTPGHIRSTPGHIRSTPGAPSLQSMMRAWAAAVATMGTVKHRSQCEACYEPARAGHTAHGDGGHNKLRPLCRVIAVALVTHHAQEPRRIADRALAD
jgi:hypothetical protein